MLLTSWTAPLKVPGTILECLESRNNLPFFYIIHTKVTGHVMRRQESINSPHSISPAFSAFYFYHCIRNRHRGKERKELVFVRTKREEQIKEQTKLLIHINPSNLTVLSLLNWPRITSVIHQPTGRNQDKNWKHLFFLAAVFQKYFMLQITLPFPF